MYGKNDVGRPAQELHTKFHFVQSDVLLSNLTLVFWEIFEAHVQRLLIRSIPAQVFVNSVKCPQHCLIPILPKVRRLLLLIILITYFLFLVRDHLPKQSM